MVFLRPTILRSREDNAALTARRYGYIRDCQLQRNPDQEPAIDALVRDYMGATPPSPPTPADVTVGPVNLPALRGEGGSVTPTDVPPSTSDAPAPPAGDYPCPTPNRRRLPRRRLIFLTASRARTAASSRRATTESGYRPFVGAAHTLCGSRSHGSSLGRWPSTRRGPPI